MIRKFYYVTKFLRIRCINNSHAKEILVNLQYEKPNMCIVICEHQARELLSIVDRALILSNCKIIAEGSPNKLIKDENAKSQYFGNFFSN